MATTAPRMRQYEHVQRRIELRPSLSVTSKRTAPQWHWPARILLSPAMPRLRFGSLVNFDVGGLDHRPPLGDLGLLPRSQRRWRQLIGRRHLQAEIFQLLAH